LHVAAATHSLRPLEFWAGLDRATRVLYGSVAVSILLHALLLSVHFSFPDSLRWRSANQPLEVTLVNARTKQRPVKARTLAQTNLDRGGNVEQQNVNASTPLPVTNAREGGTDLAEAQRRVQQLEAQQRELLTQSRQSNNQVAAAQSKETPSPDPSRTVSGRDMADLSLAAIRLQAQIDKQLKAYASRPRKQFLGASAAEYRFAHYEDEWRQKVERVGTLNYPAEARGKLYGSLRLTVTIKPDGAVESVEIDRSSGLKILDEAALKIVRMAAPYSPFPADIRKDTDLLVITRTWSFEQGDVLNTK
jgi:protein TonB